jgi:hypothetical protein
MERLWAAWREGGGGGAGCPLAAKRQGKRAQESGGWGATGGAPCARTPQGQGKVKRAAPRYIAMILYEVACMVKITLQILKNEFCIDCNAAQTGRMR